VRHAFRKSHGQTAYFSVRLNLFPSREFNEIRCHAKDVNHRLYREAHVKDEDRAYYRIPQEVIEKLKATKLGAYAWAEVCRAVGDVEDIKKLVMEVAKLV